MAKKSIDMGPGPYLGGIWTYSLFNEPELNSRLSDSSSAQTIGDTDVVSIQPCQSDSSQDRYTVLDIDGWKLRAIFDGHAGEETVDYVVETLPQIIAQKLNKGDPGDILRESIIQVDDMIKQDLFSLFPTIESFQDKTDEEIKSVINNRSPTVLRCMRGTTALVTLTDPSNTNLWVASLGDCQAVLGLQQGDEWDVSVLAANHNGTDPAEAQRVMSEHPNEPECMMKNRVLGAIAVTRAIGDFAFKLPKEYTTRIFLNSSPGFKTQSSVPNFIQRNLTPPYLSNVPDIRHVNIQGKHGFLVLCSDGLVDLYEPPEPEPILGAGDVLPNDRGVNLDDVAKIWINQITTANQDNLALHLLKQAMGGKDNDNEKICRLLTAEREKKWMDDTTIIVQKI